MQTTFSQAQMCALKDSFQSQRYLSLQQTQNLSTILNLSYKQVKTWFQNQRMKCKRWQNKQWLKTSNGLTQKGSAPVDYPSIHSSSLLGYLVIQKPSNVGQLDLDQPNLQQPDLDQPNLEQSDLDQPNLEQPDLDQLNLEQPGLYNSILVYPSLEQPVLERSSAP